VSLSVFWGDVRYGDVLGLVRRRRLTASILKVCGGV
jgi:hypothetical protein